MEKLRTEIKEKIIKPNFNNEGKTFTAPTFNKYTGLDSSAIRIMYDADVAIDPGMTKEKFYRKIEKAKREMGK